MSRPPQLGQRADLDYEGSVTIDADLMEAAGFIQYEMVHVWNITRGTRLVTYAITGKRSSGVICVNGAAAHQKRWHCRATWRSSSMRPRPDRALGPRTENS